MTCFSISVIIRCSLFRKTYCRVWELRPLRAKHTIHWAKLRRKKYATDHALSHFDEFYGAVFKEWPSIRLSLLCPNKYCAVVNLFADVDKNVNLIKKSGAEDLKLIYRQQCEQYLVKHNENKLVSDKQQVNNSLEERFELNQETSSEDNTLSDSEGKNEVKYNVLKNKQLSFASPDKFQDDSYVPVTKLKYQEEIIDEEEYYTFYKPEMEAPVSVVKENLLEYPDYWKIFLYPRGDITTFSPPKRDSLNMYGYYLMDGASILPVLAMDIKENDVVGDFCAAPGGKSLAILLTLNAGKLLCNDISFSRLKRLKNVLNCYIPSTNEWRDKIHISNLDVCSMTEQNTYDKVLLDVFCTNDRHSVTLNENNIFRPNRIKERIKIPHMQSDMLSSGLKALKIGGSLVYSTCSLSPIQNDGVIYMTLKKLQEETDLKFVVKDLADSFKPLRIIYRFSSTCKYGQLVLPFLPQNYGPLYISKISRIS